MRVFWFTNVVMPDLAVALGRQAEVIGGWMPALLDALRRRGDVQLAVATVAPNAEAVGRHEVGGVTYHCLPTERRAGSQIAPLFADACRYAVTDFRPDVIHVHGTEDVFCEVVAREAGSVPAIASIQGLLHACAPYVTGGVTLFDAMNARAAGVLSWARFLVQKAQWVERGRVEQRAMRMLTNFAGRTSWDRAHVFAVNPAARYFHCDEVLRPEFFARTWSRAGASPQTIFCAAAHSPLKGFHVLIGAVALLRERYPDIRVKVAAAPWDERRGFGYYGRFIKSLIDRHRLAGNIVPLPALNAADVARELTSARVFVIPSFIENSPNSLAEAMLVGTPVVATLTGGIPSMVVNGETALGVPVGDSVCLADAISKIFEDGVLAERLSVAGRSVARLRHDPDRVAADQVEVYRRVIQRSTSVESEG